MRIFWFTDLSGQWSQSWQFRADSPEGLLVGALDALAGRLEDAWPIHFLLHVRRDRPEGGWDWLPLGLVQGASAQEVGVFLDERAAAWWETACARTKSRPPRRNS